VAIDPSGFLERLTARSGEYNKAKVGELGALGAVYLDLKSEVARMGQQIRVYFPDLSAFTDQGANDWNPDTLQPGYIDVPFLQRPGKAIEIQDFEQFQTSTDIIEQFYDPMYKRALEYANGTVFGLVNTTNFPTTIANSTPFGGRYPSYNPIATTPSTVDVGSMRLAWNMLVRNKVPVNPETANLLYHPDLHANTMVDPAWSQENLVSAMIAVGQRNQAGEDGAANKAFKFGRLHDVQAPTGMTPTTGTGALSGTVTVANGSTTVTGSSTHFTTQVAPTTIANTNQVNNMAWVQFAGDNPLTQYPIIVNSDTSATLLSAYTGSQTSGVTMQKVTYTSLAFNKYAIALAVRPLDTNTGRVMSRIITLRGIPIRLMLDYNQLKSAWILTADYALAAAVLRPDYGVLLTS
jgi:hypothetical protein